MGGQKGGPVGRAAKSGLRRGHEPFGHPGSEPDVPVGYDSLVRQDKGDGPGIDGQGFGQGGADPLQEVGDGLSLGQDILRDDDPEMGRDDLLPDDGRRMLVSIRSEELGPGGNGQAHGRADENRQFLKQAIFSAHLRQQGF